MRHCSIYSGTKSPADSEEHEDAAIGAFRSLLERDIKSGMHLRATLPDDLAQAMLANLHHAVDLDEEINGEVAL
ncbi:MAG: AbrB/MazE/SpoVT family DNA-binding domain-containing protein [Sulfuricella sp.]